MDLFDDDDDEEDLQFLDDLRNEEDDDDEMDISLLALLAKNVQRRKSSLYRKRWDSDYLVNLAVNKGSFVSEYRLDPAGFDYLHGF